MHVLKPIKNDFYIRGITLADAIPVAEIETSSCENFWNPTDIRQIISDVQNVGYVITKIDQVVGFLIYEVSGLSLNVINLVIQPDMRRHKLGTLLLDKVKQKMHLHQVNTINFDVRESNLNAQLFLKANNFRFNKIAPDYFKDYFGEDCIPDKESAYCFSFHDYSMVVKELEVCV